MKLTVTLVSLLTAIAGPAPAEVVVVDGAPNAYAFKVATKIFESCANRFAGHLFRGQKITYSTQLSIDQRTANQAARLDYIAVTLQALSKHDGSVLATGACTANRHGWVRDLSVHNAPAVKLVGLSPRDIKLAMVSR